VCVTHVCLVCVCIVVCVCVMCVFCVNPCSVRYRVHGGVYNSQPSIDQDVRVRDFLLGCRMFGAGSGFNLELFLVQQDVRLLSGFSV